MPCLHPFPAWRTATGELSLTNRDESQMGLKLPCGKCYECRRATAREWAVRCTLEMHEHNSTCWTTLTYEEKYKPPTLKKDHLSAWLKRLRARVEPTKVRFFATGEYGERTERPHYHAILYGLSADNREIQNAWPFGHTQTLAVTPAAIAYVAGYTAKKLDRRDRFPGEKTDPATGEVYTYQAPFIHMSRGGRNGGGIGYKARDKYWPSWRQTMIANGQELPVARYLHEAWKKQATEEEIQLLRDELNAKIYDKMQDKLVRGVDEKKLQKDREINAIAKQRLASEKRQTL